MLALYYPYVYFNNASWLLSSLLYWDGIGRLTAPGLELRNPPHIQRLVDLGIVFDVVPSSDDISEVSETFGGIVDRAHSDSLIRQFLDIVRTLESSSERNWTLFARYDRASRYIEVPKPPVARRLPLSRLHFFSELPEPELSVEESTAPAGLWPFYLHEGNMTEDLRETLLARGLANRQGDMLGLPVNLARTFVTLLAEKVALRNGLIPVCPTPMDHFHGDHRRSNAAAGDASPDREGERNSRVALQLFAHFAFASVGLDYRLQGERWRSNSPDAWREVDQETERVLRLRGDIGAFRMSFQELIRTATRELPALLQESDAEIARRHLERMYGTYVDSPMKSLSRQLERINVSSRRNLMDIQVAVPTIAASTISIAGLQLDQPVMIAAGALSAAATLYGSRRSRSLEVAEALASSPVALLYSLDRALNPRTISSGMRRRRSQS